MKFEFDKTAWTTLADGEKNCYLMTNGLGGYNSMNLVGGVTRGDQAFFMAAKKAPNVRFHMITGLLETLKVDGKEYVLTSQRMKSQPDLKGFQYLESFVFDNYPQWVYRVEAVTVTKTMVMVQEENTVAVRYEIHGTDRQKAELCVKPMLRMTAKNTAFEEADAEAIALEDAKVIKNSDTVFIAANGCVARFEPQVFGPLYFSQDERDGRNETGSVLFTHSITFAAENGNNRLDCVFSTDFVKLTDDYFNEKLKNHKEHVRALMDASMATSELGRQLSVSADAYLSRRDSTNGKTILAGFPFFEDWGRDTMISLPGITMITGRFKKCKSILRTFAKYVKNGLLPNLFPEGDCNPMYNSAERFFRCLSQLLRHTKWVRIFISKWRMTA